MINVKKAVELIKIARATTKLKDTIKTAQFNRYGAWAGRDDNGGPKQKFTAEQKRLANEQMDSYNQQLEDAAGRQGKGRGGFWDHARADWDDLWVANDSSTYGATNKAIGQHLTAPNMARFAKTLEGLKRRAGGWGGWFGGSVSAADVQAAAKADPEFAAILKTPGVLSEDGTLPATSINNMSSSLQRYQSGAQGVSGFYEGTKALVSGVNPNVLTTLPLSIRDTYNKIQDTTGLSNLEKGIYQSDKGLVNDAQEFMSQEEKDKYNNLSTIAGTRGGYVSNADEVLGVKPTPKVDANGKVIPTVDTKPGFRSAPDDNINADISSQDHYDGVPKTDKNPTGFTYIDRGGHLEISNGSAGNEYGIKKAPATIPERIATMKQRIADGRNSLRSNNVNSTQTGGNINSQHTGGNVTNNYYNNQGNSSNANQSTVNNNQQYNANNASSNATADSNATAKPNATANPINGNQGAGSNATAKPINGNQEAKVPSVQAAVPNPNRARLKGNITTIDDGYVVHGNNGREALLGSAAFKKKYGYTPDASDLRETNSSNIIANPGSYTAHTNDIVNKRNEDRRDRLAQPLDPIVTNKTKY